MNLSSSSLPVSRSHHTRGTPSRSWVSTQTILRAAGCGQGLFSNIFATTISLIYVGEDGTENPFGWRRDEVKTEKSSWTLSRPRVPIPPPSRFILLQLAPHPKYGMLLPSHGLSPNSYSTVFAAPSQRRCRNSALPGTSLPPRGWFTPFTTATGRRGFPTVWFDPGESGMDRAKLVHLLCDGEIQQIRFNQFQ